MAEVTAVAAAALEGDTTAGARAVAGTVGSLGVAVSLFALELSAVLSAALQSEALQTGLSMHKTKLQTRCERPPALQRAGTCERAPARAVSGLFLRERSAKQASAYSVCEQNKDKSMWHIHHF